MAPRTMTNIIRPAPGTAAAPIDDRVAVKTITIWSASVRSCPKACAIKTAEIA